MTAIIPDAITTIVTVGMQGPPGTQGPAGTCVRKTPESATDTGTAGEMAYDDDYLYVCIATDAWKRVALSSW